MKYKLTDLIDVERTQSLLQSFFEAGGIPAAIIDLEGVVLVTSRWRRVCTDFHRANAGSRRECIESDTTLANELLQGKRFSMYQCPHGLIDAASPITIEGEHVANFFIGQFFVQGPDMEFFRRQAAHFGFDEAAYLEALSEVPIVAEESLPSILAFLTSFAEMMADLGLKQLRQMEVEKELREAREELELRVRERTEELAKTVEKLEHSNRELEAFASAASHDLQEPLRKIRGFGDTLATGYAAVLDGRGLDYLSRMQSAANRMQKLIDSLLNYSRVTTRAKPFTPVDLGRVVQEVLSDLEFNIQKNGGKVDVGPLPTIEADTTQMRQVFQNLIGNALKFHRPGESPVVEVGSRAGEPGFYDILVKDNGIGFDARHLERIFLPFERLHGRSSMYEGTGIGLAICRKIVERHGGTITAESTPGKGATFILSLPEKQKLNP